MFGNLLARSSWLKSSLGSFGKGPGIFQCAGWSSGVNPDSQADGLIPVMLRLELGARPVVKVLGKVLLYAHMLYPILSMYEPLLRGTSLCTLGDTLTVQVVEDVRQLSVLSVHPISF